MGNAVKHLGQANVAGFVRNRRLSYHFAHLVSHETSYTIRENASQRCPSGREESQIKRKIVTTRGALVTILVLFLSPVIVSFQTLARRCVAWTQWPCRSSHKSRLQRLT